MCKNCASVLVMQPDSVSSFLVHGVEGRPVTPGHCGHRQDPLLADGGVLLLLGDPLQDHLQEALLKQAVLARERLNSTLGLKVLRFMLKC